MITKELVDNKSCVFCVSDYHLEMILLPYMKEEINNSKIVILTEDDLEDSMKMVLSRVNIEENLKKEIMELNWNKKDIKNIEQYITKDKKNIIIINGKYEYINDINKSLNEITYKNINIVDCYHIGEADIDINVLSKNYKYILNTKKL